MNTGHNIYFRQWDKLNRSELRKIKALEAIKKQFLLVIKVIVNSEDVPHKFILNWSQTVIDYVVSYLSASLTL